MGSFSIFHWLVVVLVLLLLFGPRRFADAAKGLGQALRGFKEELGKPEDPHASVPPPDADAPPAKPLPPHEPTASTAPSVTENKRNS